MHALTALSSLGLVLSQAWAINARNDVCNCTPSNQAVQSWNGGCYCCPGVFEGTDDSQYCCVGGTVDVSFSSCFPFCSGTAGDQASISSQSCQTSIYLTESGYSSKASPYISSGGAVNTGGQSSGSSVPTRTSASSGGSSGDDSGSSGPGFSSSSKGAAGAIVTSGPLGGALMVAGGLMLGA